jgi:predicted DNA binding protein
MTNTTKNRMHHKPEKRKGERVAASFPVVQSNGKGITRDISATGIFFETETRFEQGSTIDFIVDLDAPADRHQRRCLLKFQGEIVRVEQHNSKMGVAVKITDSQLRYVQD